MPKALLPKRTFGLGEMSPDFLFRRDTDQYLDAAKKMRNARQIDSGAFEDRPGTFRIVTSNLNGILISFYFNNTQKYELLFTDTAMYAYLEDGTAAGSLTSAPWTTAMLDEMRWYQDGDTVFVAHRDMPTQVIKRTGASTFTRTAYAFDTGFGSSVAQPYYKFALDAVTLTPSSTTGSITLTTSASFFVAGHVGTRVRYLDREIEITAVTNGTTATGTVRQTLPAAQRLTVASSAGFEVGHIIEHDPNGTKGIVFNVPDSTHIDVIPNDGLDAFPASGSVISQDAKTTVSATASATLPALKNWDEQVFSSVRGYAGGVAIHRERLFFVDHSTIPDAIMASVIGQYYNFDLGTADDNDAIFEFFGDAKVERVSDIVSAENLIFCTNAGTHYLAERIGQPFTATNFIVRPFDTFSASSTSRAVKFEKNIYYAHENGKILVQVFPTGNIESPWDSRNISLFSPHLIRNPVCIAAAEKFETYPERYVFIVNDDGTMAVLHSITDQSVQGLTLWETQGSFKSVCVVGDDVFVLVEREIDGDTVYWLERFDEGAATDAVVEFDDPSDTITGYNNETVRVTASTYDYGDVTVGSSGEIEVSSTYDGPFQAGLHYDLEVEIPTPELVDSGSSISSKIKRIARAYIHTVDSGRYFVNGRPNTSYKTSDNLTQPPPARTGIRRFANIGRGREPTVLITREQAVPLKVIGIGMEVIY